MMKARWPVLPLLVILIATITTTDAAATTVSTTLAATTENPVTDSTSAAATTENPVTDSTSAAVTTENPVTDSTSDAVTTENPVTDASDAVTTENPGSNATADVNTGAPSTDAIDIGPSDPKVIRCYTCTDAVSNEDCIGERLGENGTMQVCEMPFPQCKSEFKMNPTGDGYLIRKSCIDADECYDNMWDSILDPLNAQCMGPMYTGLNHTVDAEAWCFFCCLDPSDMDGCNGVGHIHRIPLPEENLWDPKMNWDLTMKEDEDDEDNAAVTTAVASPTLLLSIIYVALSIVL
ncbi:63 kDa sperm flagellar membrane protein-like isoform X25 [Apostichopus japonicus]|uniref:63 kDa sperm flagellar membrane protein-like isoform X25 n=1 Tax=Stichopus japonicus TaxID=307972 RepID=UPI003AB7204B